MSVNCWGESIREWVLLHKRGENCALMAQVGEGVWGATQKWKSWPVLRTDGAPVTAEEGSGEQRHNSMNQQVWKFRSLPKFIRDTRSKIWSMEFTSGKRPERLRESHTGHTEVQLEKIRPTHRRHLWIMNSEERLTSLLHPDWLSPPRSPAYLHFQEVLCCSGVRMASPCMDTEEMGCSGRLKKMRILFIVCLA